jgi:hypothetical protein
MRYLSQGAIFILTGIGNHVSFNPLQPKSGFLPEAGCGRTKLLK